MSVLFVSASFSQGNKKFDPARFEADLEKFITAEARLTQSEATKFFPLYREMRQKQMTYFKKDRDLFRNTKTTDKKACEKTIREHDANEIAIKKIQSTYHSKFLKVLSPTKILQIIKAEDKFHRQLFSRSGSHKGGRK